MQVVPGAPAKEHHRRDAGRHGDGLADGRDDVRPEPRLVAVRVVVVDAVGPAAHEDVEADVRHDLPEERDQDDRKQHKAAK